MSTIQPTSHQTSTKHCVHYFMRMRCFHNIYTTLEDTLWFSSQSPLYPDNMWKSSRRWVERNSHCAEGECETYSPIAGHQVTDIQMDENDKKS